MPARWRGVLAEEWEHLWGKLASLEPRVQDFIVEHLAESLHNWLECIKKCESPIEQLMAIALEMVFEMLPMPRGVDVIINPQEEIKAGQETYRVDFFLACVVRSQDLSQYEHFGVIVECDGHDFHEKTKEQAAKDRARDRALIAQGYTVLRFTGSEIWKSPIACARQVRNVVLNKVRAIPWADLSCV